MLELVKIKKNVKKYFVLLLVERNTKSVLFNEILHDSFHDIDTD